MSIICLYQSQFKKFFSIFKIFSAYDLFYLTNERKKGRVFFLNKMKTSYGYLLLCLTLFRSRLSVFTLKLYDLSLYSKRVNYYPSSALLCYHLKVITFTFVKMWLPNNITDKEDLVKIVWSVAKGFYRRHRV